MGSQVKSPAYSPARLPEFYSKSLGDILLSSALPNDMAFPKQGGYHQQDVSCRVVGKQGPSRNTPNCEMRIETERSLSCAHAPRNHGTNVLATCQEADPSQQRVARGAMADFDH